jgi:hypothetical protein
MMEDLVMIVAIVQCRKFRRELIFYLFADVLFISHFCWWNIEILKPIQREGTEGGGRLAFRKLSVLLDSIMLRRTVWFYHLSEQYLPSHFCH